MRKHYFKDGEGKSVLSTTDGAYFTDMLEDFEIIRSSEAIIYFEFFSDVEGSNIVTPSGGIITSFGSPMGNNYLEFGDNSTTSAIYVQAGESTYNPPAMFGLVSKGKIVLSGIQGASFMRAVMATG